MLNKISNIFKHKVKPVVSNIEAMQNAVLYKTDRSHLFYIFISALSAIALLGVYGALASYFVSLEVMEFHHDIPWAMSISTYIFFVVSSTGLCIVTSLGHVFGRKDYEIIGKRGVFLAIITIVYGMLAIGLHLGHPERSAVYIWLTPNIGSAIWGMGFFYTFYIVFILIEYWLLARVDLVHLANTSNGLKQIIYKFALFGVKDESHESVERDHKFAKWIGIAALVAGLSAHSTLGAVFGHIESIPYWYGIYYPIYFLLSATFSGLAWIITMIVITYRIERKTMSYELKELLFEMANVFVVLLCIGMLFTLYKITSSLWDPVKAEYIMLFFRGPFSVPFYVFEIVIGTLIPILLLLYSLKKRWLTGLMIASVLVLVGLFFMRYDFVVAGQIYPVFEDRPLPAVFPSVMEIFLIAGICSVFVLSYVFAIKFLPLDESAHNNGHSKAKTDGDSD